MSLLSLGGHVGYYLYMGNADMRRTFEGLCGLVRNEMNQDPLDHQVYIFINKRRTQVKLLLWEGDGFSIYHKRLEAGTFERPVMIEYQAGYPDKDTAAADSSGCQTGKCHLPQTVHSNGLMV